jgi:hypothetical protein
MDTIHISELVLDNYVDAHPLLEDLYHTDAITRQVMDQSAQQGFACVVMLFMLAKAQLEARQALEHKLAEHLKQHPPIFTTP